MTILDLKRGESAIVLGLGVVPAVKERLRALNVYPRASVTLLKTSLFRRTFLLDAGGVRLALRRAVAAEIRVVKK